MRNLLILLFLCLWSTLSGATYYVATNGSDSNPGTITQPFFTLNKAWTVVVAGDIIYMRGGTYHYGTTMNILADKNGTSGNTIKVWAYPGEFPVIDYAGVNLTGQKIGLRLHNINYVHFKGFRVANMAQENTGNAWPNYGIILYDDVSNCTFEQLEVDHIGGTGFTIADRCNNNLFLNCDSHHHQDPYSAEPYGMSDGFESGSHGSNTSTNNTFRNCRAWANSDDGWDFRQADGVYTLDGCWSFRNGFIPGTTTTAGNGDGYKLGGKTGPGTSAILRTIKNSLAFENRSTGITPEPDASDNVFGLDMYNCTSYKNARDLGEGINTGNYNNYARVRNCIAYANIHSNIWMQGGAVNDHNNWDLPKTVTDADFVSVNSSGVDGPRQSDGSLPVTTFLHLASGSDLIDVGVDCGQTCTNAPDLGAFEYQTVSPPASPVYVSSAIQNATPSLLEMTYNLSLANIVPSASSFSVLVNSAARTINSVVISGTKVQLTLTSPVINGNVVTVSYTKPSSNPIQTAAGGQAITIGTQTVTNNVSAVIPVAPVYVSSVIQNPTPSLLEMTYNLSLANIVPSASSFSVLVNSAARTIKSVVISGAKVQLTLASPVVNGNVVTVSYTKPSSNPIQTAAGGQAITIGTQTVTNNVSAVATVNLPPIAAITSPASNATFMSSTNITITAAVSDPDGSVSLVEFYNGSVKLGSVSAAPYSFTWSNVATGNYNLTVTATDNLNAKTTSSLIYISVKKRSNKHPVVQILNPIKGISYENVSSIPFEALASDSDGIVTKVEFFNGSEKLVELTSAPYTYTWKDVHAGSYLITAVATDDSNDSTTSAPVEFKVDASIKNVDTIIKNTNTGTSTNKYAFTNSHTNPNSDLINLFPNPNNGQFSIEFKDPLENERSEIIITDLSGKQVYNDFVSREEIVKQFDMSSINKGMYVLMIRDKQILFTKKFIKK